MDGDGGGGDGSDLVTEGRTEDGVVRDRWSDDSTDSTESKLQSLGYQIGGGDGSNEMGGETDTLAALIGSSILKVTVALLSVAGAALLLLYLL
ncbi:hypothetical protein [Haloarchaeobius sp. DFWS5]|uniref:hypothetical protein n=1 Tax=Haloarchaeobius sp. DFWS5 TaxID=3446114 RepID=UPI003EBC335B